MEYLLAWAVGLTRFFALVSCRLEAEAGDAVRTRLPVDPQGERQDRGFSRKVGPCLETDVWLAASTTGTRQASRPSRIK